MKINTNDHYLKQKNSTYTVSEDQSQRDEENDESTYKYKLVGTMVRIMLVKNGVEVSCVKSIPVKNASPEIIAKIENLTFVDMVMINELQREKHQPKEGSSDLPKEHAEYEKHLIYESNE